MAWTGEVAKVTRSGLVPHSNQASVARPFGFTFPLSVAPVVPTPVAVSVVTVGAAPRVTHWMFPLLVPDPLLAATR